MNLTLEDLGTKSSKVEESKQPSKHESTAFMDQQQPPLLNDSSYQISSGEPKNFYNNISFQDSKDELSRITAQKPVELIRPYTAEID